MPTVGSQKFPYTPNGMKAANLVAKRTGRKVVMDNEAMKEVKAEKKMGKMAEKKETKAMKMMEKKTTPAKRKRK